MSEYQPVGCALIEHLELATLQRREITVTLNDHTRHRGRILDVETRADKSEWLLLSCAAGTPPLAIRLDQLQKLELDER